MADQARRCGICQRMRANDISSDDGKIFICEGCNEDAGKLLEIVGSLGALPEGPEPG